MGIIIYLTKIKGLKTIVWTIVHKGDNLEETETFLETCKLPKLTQEEMENLNRPITSKVIESVTKKPPNKENPRQDDFTGGYYQKFAYKSKHQSFSNSSKT